LAGADIEMAKRLGFGPDALIRSIPSPKQKWKAPVKYWIRDLYAQRFGDVLGEKPAAPAPVTFEYDEEAVRLYGEQLYWEEYWERNRDSAAMPRSAQRFQSMPAPTPAPAEFSQGITDDDVPF
jgi:hypothetical protein